MYARMPVLPVGDQPHHDILYIANTTSCLWTSSPPYTLHLLCLLDQNQRGETNIRWEARFVGIEIRFDAEEAHFSKEGTYISNQLEPTDVIHANWRRKKTPTTIFIAILRLVYRLVAQMSAREGSRKWMEVWRHRCFASQAATMCDRSLKCSGVANKKYFSPGNL